MDTYNDDANRQLAMQYQNQPQPQPAKCGFMDYIRSHKLLVVIVILLLLALIWWFFLRKKNEVNVNVNASGTRPLNGTNGRVAMSRQ